MSTDLDKLRERLINNGVSKTQTNEFISNLKDPTVQQLIYNYSNGTKETNPKKLYLDETFPVQEPWVGSLAIMLDGYSFVDKENEVNGKETKLKDAVMNLAQKIKTIGNGDLTQQVAQEIFSNKEKADTFFKLNAAWTTFLVFE